LPFIFIRNKLYNKVWYIKKVFFLY
jgi:hypothetical protein